MVFMEIKSCKVHDIFSILKTLWSIRDIGITDESCFHRAGYFA